MKRKSRILLNLRSSFYANAIIEKKKTERKDRASGIGKVTDKRYRSWASVKGLLLTWSSCGFSHGATQSSGCVV